MPSTFIHDSADPAPFEPATATCCTTSSFDATDGVIDSEQRSVFAPGAPVGSVTSADGCTRPAVSLRTALVNDATFSSSSA